MIAHKSYHESRDALQSYLNNIGKVALLTATEEKKLAKEIRKGSTSAREQMISANLRLVVKIAKDYMNCGLGLEDLVAEGNLGLIRAVEKFNPKFNTRFSTYGAWWIKQSVRRALANHSKTIRLPVHVVDKLQKIRRASHQLTEILGRIPDDSEVADELNIPVSKVTRIRSASHQMLSLDASSNNNDTDLPSFSEILADEQALDPAFEASDKNIKENILTALNTLDDREQKILALRFGLNGEKELTLANIGKKFKLTRERIRQLQNSALNKLQRRIKQQEGSAQAHMLKSQRDLEIL
jgi:RNA polymerase primary sigma factor